MTNYGVHTEVPGSFETAVAKVTEALQAEGFGVLTEIDVQATLQKKLGVGFRRYKILGACNPPFAHRALQARLDVGLLLPCNVIVYEQDDHAIHVAAIDPMQTVASSDPALAEVAAEVGAKLGRVIARLGERT